jgi:polyisoprenoid-binding protein YceI
VPTAQTAVEATEFPAAASPTTEGNTQTTVQGTIYQIDSSRSEATFTLNEKLLGNPKTVVGTTSKVSGKISVSQDNPSNSQLGTIQIDASALQTDSDMRDRAIQRFILESSQAQYQYITFEPTAIEGLPAKVTVGEAIPLKITGNLKIRDVVKPVTFDATVTVPSEGEISGTAKATVTRSAFDLTIPSVPSVADVTDEVALELQFVATQQ